MTAGPVVSDFKALAGCMQQLQGDDSSAQHSPAEDSVLFRSAKGQVRTVSAVVPPAQYEPLQPPIDVMQQAAAALQLQSTRNLLMILLAQELDAILAWASPSTGTLQPSLPPAAQQFSVFAIMSSIRASHGATSEAVLASNFISAAVAAGPKAAVSAWQQLHRMLPQLTPALEAAVAADPAAFVHEAAAIRLLVTPAAASTDSPALDFLSLWASASPTDLLHLLSRCSPQQTPQLPLFHHPAVSAYVIRCLRLQEPEAITFYLPQLVQALRHDSHETMASFLVDTAQHSLLVALQLVWALTAESVEDEGAIGQLAERDALVGHAVDPALPPAAVAAAPSFSLAAQPSAAASSGKRRHAAAAERYGFQNQLAGRDPLPSACNRLLARILTSLPPTSRGLVLLNSAFWEGVTNVSARLKTEVLDKTARKAKAKDFLRDLRTMAERDALEIVTAVRPPLLQAPLQSQPQFVGSADVTAESHDTAAGAAASNSSTQFLLAEVVARFPLAGSVKLLGGKLPKDVLREIGSGVGRRSGDAAADSPAAAASEASATLTGWSVSQAARNILSMIPHAVFLPTDPSLRVVGVDMDSARPMQSASKAPYLLTFSVLRTGGPDEAMLRYSQPQPPAAVAAVSYGAACTTSSAPPPSDPASALRRDAIFTIARASMSARVAASNVRKNMDRSRVQLAHDLSARRKDMQQGLRRMVEGASSAADDAGSQHVQPDSAAAVEVPGRDRSHDEHNVSSSLASTPVSASDIVATIGGQAAPPQLVSAAAAENALSSAIAAPSTPSPSVFPQAAAQQPSIASPFSSPQYGVGQQASPLGDSEHHNHHRTPLSFASRLLRRDATASASLSSPVPSATPALPPVSESGPLAAAAAADSGAVPQESSDLQRPIASAPSRPMRSSCILKVYDDCRQDALAVQVMELLRRVFNDAGLGLRLFPYSVIPTRCGSKRIPGGVITVIPDVRSMDELGKSGFRNLHEYFLSTYGRPDGAQFEAARLNLIKSLAAYAVVSYILLVKDRHNGNLLVSAEGDVIHIDFGFLLGISPGGNLMFERVCGGISWTNDS